MTVRIDKMLCTGCGTCVDICSFDAIQLVNQHAVIDQALCTLNEMLDAAESKGQEKGNHQ